MTLQRRPMVVLQVLPDPARYPGPIANPYTVLLVRSLDPARIETRYFTWKRSFLEPFDVIHFHWPEYMMRHRRRTLGTVKTLLLAAFLLRVRLQRKIVVRTLHNERPHEPGSWLERRVARSLDRLTVAWIALNPSTRPPLAANPVIIPHGHYRDWYPAPRIGSSTQGRILCFGLVRAYKGTSALIRAASELCDGTTLMVAGKPASDADRMEVVRAAAGVSNVQLDLRFLGDQALADVIASAEAIVLPYPSLHNSGAALLALSLHRPIIVPKTEASSLLQEEFGEEWVTTYEGPLDGSKLHDSLARVRAFPRALDGPAMIGREWSGLSEKLMRLYESLGNRPASAIPNGLG